MALYSDGVSPAAFLRGCVVSPATAARADEREPDEARVTAVTANCITSADGSALARLGNTAVVCGVRAELSRASTTAAAASSVTDAGVSSSDVLVPCLELPAVCHSRWGAGPPPERAQQHSARLAAALRASQCVDVQLLTAAAADGRAAWTLYCDAVCICDDGNVFEAAMLAVSAALASVTLPAVTCQPDCDQVLVDVTRRHRLPGLRACQLPVAAVVTLAAQSGGGTEDSQQQPVLLLDPTAAEEESDESSELIAVWSADKLVHVSKPGGVCVSASTLDRCVKMTQTRARQLRKLLEAALK